MFSAVKNSWSVNFYRQMSRYVSPASVLRLRGLVLRETRGCRARAGLVRVNVRRPFRSNVWLREPGTDFGTFREVILHSIYQRVTEVVDDCKYILDLGANIGLTSLFLAHRFPACHIMAVEPSIENQAILSRNLRSLVRKGRCKICCGAVWSSDAELDLMPPPGGTGFDAIQVSARDKFTPGLKTCVKGFTVDTLVKMAGFPHVDILKVDVEGAETPLFQGRTEWLQRVNAIAVEFHGESRKESGFDDVASRAGMIIEDDISPNTIVAYRRNADRVQ